MSTIKTFAAIAASTLAIGGTTISAANAQPWNDRTYSDNRLTTSYVDSLEWRINNAAGQGVISRGQARDLLGQLRSVQPLAWRYETGQASPGEVRRLETVVNRIEAATSTYAYNRPPWR